MEQCTIHRFINIYLINLNEQMIPLSFFPKNYATSRINRKKLSSRVQTENSKENCSKTIYSAVEYLSVDQRRFLIKNEGIRG